MFRAYKARVSGKLLPVSVDRWCTTSSERSLTLNTHHRSRRSGTAVLRKTREVKPSGTMKKYGHITRSITQKRPLESEVAPIDLMKGFSIGEKTKKGPMAAKSKLRKGKEEVHLP